MTWCPSTMQAKAARSAQDRATEKGVSHLGCATRLTRDRRELPPSVRAWPLRVYLDHTEQPANDPTELPEPEPPRHGEYEATSRHRGLHAANRLKRD